MATVRLGLKSCGSVGRAVASGTRDPPFKSNQRQKVLLRILMWDLPRMAHSNKVEVSS